MDHTMLRKIFFILSLITFFLSTATAAVYKWVDDQGNVHYSEQKPAQSPAEKIKIDKAPPPSSSSYKKPTLKTEEEGNNKGESTDNANSKNADIAKQKQEMCAEARKDLELMQNTGRLRVKDKDGNVTYMTDEDKAARIKRNQDRVKEYCQ